MFSAGSGVFAGNLRNLCGLRIPLLHAGPWRAFLAPVVRWSSREERSGKVAARGNGKVRKVSCDDCFFGRNGLCALALDEPCATFRPDHPEGLRPPSQLRFVFRQERRRQAAWAFPTAQEQAALHA
jgi:hypothetical protein